VNELGEMKQNLINKPASCSNDCTTIERYTQYRAVSTIFLLTLDQLVFSRYKLQHRYTIDWCNWAPSITQLCTRV